MQSAVRAGHSKKSSRALIDWVNILVKDLAKEGLI